MSDVKKVYTAIASVTKAMASAGIAKDRKNESQGYKFRGIDDVYNALSHVLAEHRLCILPTVLERWCEERKNAKGTALFYVTVQVRFDLVSADDGSSHSVVTFGEAMDSGDKATNKAMSAAFKYACMQAFCIPTEGDNDADSHTHEVASKSNTRPTDAQIQQLEDWTAVEGMDAKYLKRINELLAAHKSGDLTSDKAQQAIDAMTKTFATKAD